MSGCDSPRASAAGLVVVAMLGCATPTPTPTPTPRPTLGNSAGATQRPAGGAADRPSSVASKRLADAELTSVDATSIREAWAVGDYHDGSRDLALIERWNGRSWTVSSGADLGPGKSALTGVDAVSKDDVWAVGEQSTKSSGTTTLVEHWDGRSWTRVPSPNPGGVGGTTLTSICATSAENAWAVGAYNLAAQVTTHPLALHWNGRRWVDVSPRKAPGIDEGFQSCSAAGARAAWAVGVASANGSQTSEPYVQHWNGGAWSGDTMNGPGRVGNVLNGVGVVARHDVWAVGAYTNDPATTSELIEHYEHRQWTRVRGPDLGADSSALSSIAARTAKDSWAVGQQQHGDSYQTLVLHWNGVRWSHSASPSPAGVASLAGVAALNASSAWAVGTYSSHGKSATLVLHWNGSVWTKTPSP